MRFTLSESSSVKSFPKQKILELSFKSRKLLADRMSKGRAFHNLGAANMNVQSPGVLYDLEEGY